MFRRGLREDDDEQRMVRAHAFAPSRRLRTFALPRDRSS